MGAVVCKADTLILPYDQMPAWASYPVKDLLWCGDYDISNRMGIYHTVIGDAIGPGKVYRLLPLASVVEEVNVELTRYDEELWVNSAV